MTLRTSPPSFSASLPTQRGFNVVHTVQTVKNYLSTYCSLQSGNGLKWIEMDVWPPLPLHYCSSMFIRTSGPAPSSAMLAPWWRPPYLSERIHATCCSVEHLDEVQTVEVSIPNTAHTEGLRSLIPTVTKNPLDLDSYWGLGTLVLAKKEKKKKNPLYVSYT